MISTEPSTRLSRIAGLNGTEVYTESLRFQVGASAGVINAHKEKLTNSVSATLAKVKQATMFDYHLESHVTLLKDMSILVAVTVWIETPFDDEL